MTALEKALTEFRSVERTAQGSSKLHSLDPRAKTVVTIVYIATVLSISLDSLPALLIFWVFPIIASAMGGIGYGEVMRKSLYTLPLIAFIGIFNPMLHREPMLYAGAVAISRGWVEFLAILLRGLLTVQMVIVLIMTTGFYKVCRGLNRMGVPSVFTTQMMLVYRYIYVLVDEAIDMDRARKSRSYGRKSYKIRMWGIFVGQLLIRTVNRAQRIHMAMLSRGFHGEIRALNHTKWHIGDTLFLIAACGCIIACRLVDIGALLNIPA